MVHALDPYGFAWRLRANEDGVDLNRSFRDAGSLPPEPPALQRQLAGFINPGSAPGLVDDYYLRIVLLLAPYGLGPLSAALPVGQYENAQGLFFGGHQPTAAQEILETRLASWIGNAEASLVLDLHTGLGRSTELKLLFGASLDRHSRQKELAALETRYGELLDEPLTTETEARPYVASGLLNDWIPPDLAVESHVALTAEVRTYRPTQVLQALRAENRAHHWRRPLADHTWIKTLLVERFAPVSKEWRRRSLHGVLELFAGAFASPSLEKGTRLESFKTGHQWFCCQAYTATLGSLRIRSIR